MWNEEQRQAFIKNTIRMRKNIGRLRGHTQRSYAGGTKVALNLWEQFFQVPSVQSSCLSCFILFLVWLRALSDVCASLANMDSMWGFLRRLEEHIVDLFTPFSIACVVLEVLFDTEGEICSFFVLPKQDSCSSLSVIIFALEVFCTGDKFQLY